MTYTILDEEHHPLPDVDRLAPAMVCDVDAVLSRGKRLRQRRRTLRAVGAAATTGFGAMAVVAVVSWGAERPPVEAPSGGDRLASDVLAVLGQPDSGRAPLNDDPSVPAEILDTARFLGGTTGGNAYAAVGEDGEICLVLSAPGAAGQWSADYACVPLDVFTRSGVQLSPSADPASTVWLVPDYFDHTVEGWMTAADNLLEPAPTYQTNDLGKTYGPMVSGPNGQLPDLIPVLADNGREGYVYRVELYDPEPGGPAENGDGSPGPDSIPVYESDGVTQVGTYPRP